MCIAIAIPKHVSFELNTFNMIYDAVNLKVFLGYPIYYKYNYIFIPLGEKKQVLLSHPKYRRMKSPSPQSRCIKEISLEQVYLSKEDFFFYKC